MENFLHSHAAIFRRLCPFVSMMQKYENFLIYTRKIAIIFGFFPSPHSQVIHLFSYSLWTSVFFETCKKILYIIYNIT